MTAFQPSHCPWPQCPSQRGDAGPHIQRRGFFRTRHQPKVQRFLCLVCKRSFSTQTFRLDYRLRYPDLHLKVFWENVSKVTLRQSGRKLKVDRKTIAHRLHLLGVHAEAFHTDKLRQPTGAGFHGPFQLDELETFESDRRLQPLTVPVLIHRRNYFVVHLDAGTLPCRGKLTPKYRQKKQAREKLFGKRRSESRKLVTRCFEILQRALPPDVALELQSDRKQLYGSVLAKVFEGERPYRWRRESSKTRRDNRNLLFPINHTLAQMRDSISRLVRRNWGVSKQCAWLRRHLWVWLIWRNYVRPVTVKPRVPTPAQIAGVCSKPLTAEEVFTWRIF
ncbi:MAG: hypothetical protein DWQ01_12380 [Planctomycetota bacterium]|nr:MAG: hypothetical protein DWQ01_12380 [Planctomycetota bacterium]